jgi:hypothetical protein
MSETTQRAALVASGWALPTPPGPCRVQAVDDGGKWRVVTVNGDEDLCLRPLHRLMYNHLSRQPWLLRGDAVSSRFKEFSSLDGEVFVSGDYASATDSIPLDIYHEMLKAVAMTSTEVPDSIWQFAVQNSVKSFVSANGGLLGVQGRGQLMGSYLSFPFLCLLNYLCFRYSIKRRVPLRINGDDIVFRCTEEEKERWVANVRRSGLVLSLGKTLVHPNYFTLNSCLFRGTPVGCSRVPFFRPKAYFSAPENAEAIGGQLMSLVVGCPGSPVKDEIMSSFLRRSAKKLGWSMMSLTRDLGVRVSRKVLRMSGLYDRERFYLGLPPPRGVGSVLPGGFHRTILGRGVRKKSQREEEALFFRCLTEMAWLGWSPTVPRRGITRYRRMSWSAKLRRLSGFLGRGRSIHLGIVEDRGKEREDIWCFPSTRFVPGGIVG